MNFRIAFPLTLIAGLLVTGCATTRSNTANPSAPTSTAASDVIAGDTATLVVFGLSCPQCSDNVRQQLVMVEGVEDVAVDLGSGDVTVTLQPGVVTRQALEQAIVRSGYSLQEIRAES